MPLTSRSDRPASTARHRLQGRLDPQGGQGVVEYGLILSLSAGLAAVLLIFFGGTLSAVLKVIGDAIDAAS